jgi:SNF2 family DNA or RNA helicase
MTNYPNINDDDFYEKIANIYKKFKVPKSNKTLEDICYPKEFKLQLPQLFLSEFINPKTPYMGVLVYHRIGAGKTCTGVRIAEKFKNTKRIIVVVPASLKNNFRNELRSLCGENNYLKPNERSELAKLHPTNKKYKEIIASSDERIDKYYEIYSYNKFVELLDNNELNFKNAILIIDEVQNMVSEDGSYYRILYNAIYSAPKDLRIVLLSATPMFDRPNELALTLNLLRPKQLFPIGTQFNNTFIQTIQKSDGTYSYSLKNIKLFKKLCKGYISYFRGAPPVAFPKMTIKYIYCEMSNFQYDAYLRVATNEDTDDKNELSLNVSDLPNNFYIGTRMISNVVFPNKKINDQGYQSFTTKSIINKLSQYSIKFDKIMEKIKKTNGKIFIYSNFKEYGGIKSFVRVLNAFGYEDYSAAGPGPKRYAIWSGDEDKQKKEEIRSVYNMKDNLTGKKIKILLGSPSISVGVSLFSVRQVHILEPYWNQSKLDQAIGRASRFCSHMTLPEEKRKVKVYIYIACAPGYLDGKKVKMTIDQHIYNLAQDKQKLITKFENIVKEVAIDCSLNKKANVYEGENDIQCEI